MSDTNNKIVKAAVHSLMTHHLFHTLLYSPPPTPLPHTQTHTPSTHPFHCLLESPVRWCSGLMCLPDMHLCWVWPWLKMVMTKEKERAGGGGLDMSSLASIVSVHSAVNRYIVKYSACAWMIGHTALWHCTWCSTLRMAIEGSVLASNPRIFLRKLLFRPPWAVVLTCRMRGHLNLIQSSVTVVTSV